MVGEVRDPTARERHAAGSTPTATRAARLRRAAIAVLAGNDAGGWTRPAPRLYPHQWSWDSAFATMGWAAVDLDRALTELERLFAGQWGTGMVPYIVYDPAVPADAYFPDADRWGCAAAPQAPRGYLTGGLCQPPVHAIALERVWARAAGQPGSRAAIRKRLRRLYPAVLAWHRYLATYRDPQCSGLVTVYHPWESGTDNSPRWDGPLDRLVIGDLPRYVRRDTQAVTDPQQRPADRDYDRYLWLLELLKRRQFDEAAIAAEHPFAVKDVFFSAVFAAANQALLALCEVVDAPREDRALIQGWVRRGQRGLARCWDPGRGVCLDYDLRTQRFLPHRTFAGLGPLLVDGVHAGLREGLLRTLESGGFLAAPALLPGVLPSTSPDDPAFTPRNYWRGPCWPVIGWLFWDALHRAGEPATAATIRSAALDLIAGRGFHEYFDPRTGDGLGSPDQTWTAAVTVDWLSEPVPRHTVGTEP